MIRPIDRRTFLSSLLAAGLARTGSATAQSRVDQLKVVLGYPPGGSVDVVARRLAERLTGVYARTAIVENRPGAAGRLAVDAVKSAAPDGSTLLVTPGSVMTLYPHVYRSLSYDPMADVVPVAIVAVSGFALAVGPGVPASVRSVPEFVAWCRAQSGPVACGNAGAGSFQHFLAMLVARETGAPLNHVPYKGGLAAMTAVGAGEVPCALSTESAALGAQGGGRVRTLATSGPARSEFFPDAPTFGELGFPALVQREWFASYMPRGTPPAAAAAAAESIGAALRETEVRDAWRRIGLAAESSTPDELRRAQRTEHDFWGPVIRASGFTPEA